MNKLVEKLRNYAEWAEANIYEVPIMLPDDLRAAADAITAAVENLASLEKSVYCPLVLSAVGLDSLKALNDEFERNGVRKEEE